MAKFYCGDCGTKAIETKLKKVVIRQCPKCRWKIKIKLSNLPVEELIEDYSKNPPDWFCADCGNDTLGCECDELANA